MRKLPDGYWGGKPLLLQKIKSQVVKGLREVKYSRSELRYYNLFQTLRQWPQPRVRDAKSLQKMSIDQSRKYGKWRCLPTIPAPPSNMVSQWVYLNYSNEGDNELTLRDIAKPKLQSPNDVLIRIHAVSLNYRDVPFLSPQ